MLSSVVQQCSHAMCVAARARLRFGGNMLSIVQVRPIDIARLASIQAGLLAGSVFSFGQCTTLLKESFYLGERPHGGNGDPRLAEIGDTLKDYWPQVPGDNGTKWITGDGNQPRWSFAATSTDPVEFDPLDEFNGTAWPDATAAAVVQFAAPSTVFRTSVDFVIFFPSQSPAYMGYTASPAIANNFETNGTLWMSADGDGNWSLFANGTQIVASGVAVPVGTFDSGWLHMEFTFDPAQSLVWGRVMDSDIPPTSVTLTRPLSYFGFEAPAANVSMNNVVVTSGDLLSASLPAAVRGCPGESVTLEGSTNTEFGLFGWLDRYGNLLHDGPQFGGSIISGATSPQMTISGLTAADAGEYRFVVANECGMATSAATALSVCGGGCVGDLNCDCVVDLSDLTSLLANFGVASGATHRQGDLTGDGAVELTDLAMLLSGFGAGCP